MSYSIVNPPFTLKFREMSLEQLSEYREWFLESIFSRISTLQDEIRESGATSWRPDFTKNSVDLLGLWLASQVQVRQRTTEEFDSIKSKTAFNFDISDKELTNGTFSLAMDVGIYLGMSLLKNYPHLKWSQPTTDRNFVDFGQMVLLGFGKVPFNPVRIAITFCYGVADGQQVGSRLGEIYDYWSLKAKDAIPN